MDWIAFCLATITGIISPLVELQDKFSGREPEFLRFRFKKGKHSVFQFLVQTISDKTASHLV